MIPIESPSKITLKGTNDRRVNRRGRCIETIKKETLLEVLDHLGNPAPTNSPCKELCKRVQKQMLSSNIFFVVP